MKQDSGLHQRRSIRLPGYDYSQDGVYFVTICTQNRLCLFGDVVNVKMALNRAGRVVAESWQWLGEQYEHVELDEWVIMPNHLHGIIAISERRGGSRTAPTGQRKPLGRLIGAFKTVSTKHINKSRKSPGANYGNAIITNISFAMKTNGAEYGNTS